jgi:hypothetical protein
MGNFEDCGAAGLEKSMARNYQNCHVHRVKDIVQSFSSASILYSMLSFL